MNSVELPLLVIQQTAESNLLLSDNDNWKVATMPKLRAYKTFKSDFQTEEYVKSHVLSERQR